MKLNSRFFSLLLIFVLISQHKNFADNGFYPYGIGSSGTSAGAALPVEATNVEANPALLSRMSNHWIAAGGLEYVKVSLNSSPALIGNPIGNQTGSLPYRPHAVFGICCRPNERWAYGVGSAGAGSLVKYDQSITGFPGPVNGKYNRQLKQAILLLNPTIAYNVSCNQSYGFSLVFGAAQLKTDVTQPIPPAFPETKGNGLASYVLGIGVRIGGFWTLTDWLNIGASLSSPVYFQKNTKYQDVLPHRLNVPAIARIGFDFHIGDCSHLFIDIKEIFYKEVKTFDDFGWKNQTVFIIGLRQQLTCNLIGSLAYNYGKSPITSSNVLLNGLINAIIEHHFIAGIQYKITECVDLTLDGLYMPSKKLTDNGTGKLGPAAEGTIAKAQGWGANIGIIVRY